MGTSPLACGAHGATCAGCVAGQACSGGMCIDNTAGGGGTSSGGGVETGGGGSSGGDATGGGGNGGGTGGGASGLCQSCLASTACPSGSTCVQIGGSDRCAPACPTEGCGSGLTCASVTSVEGPSVSACVPQSASCTGGVGCGACTAGEVCNYSAGHCVTIVTDGGPPPPPPDAGSPLPPISGTVGPNGGSVSRLFFAITGDTRPDSINSTSNYPTPLIRKIFTDIQGLSPRPQFVLATGDYMFASTTSTTGAAQIGLYAQAAALFTGGPLYPVMGNHECDGATTGNCAGRVTENITAFKSTLLANIGKTKTYYTVSFSSSVPTYPWTAKLIVLSCNEWDSTQLSWFNQQVAVPTTYTFITRHESTHADAIAPCINDTDPVIMAHPPNLLLVGHTHTFEVFKKSSTYNALPVDEVVAGMGGAMQQLNPGQIPVYGYATIEQVATGFKITEFSSDDPASPIYSYTSPF
jgi:hypothetical protein